MQLRVNEPTTGHGALFIATLAASPDDILDIPLLAPGVRTNQVFIMTTVRDKIIMVVSSVPSTGV